MAAVAQLKNILKVSASPSISVTETVPIVVTFSLTLNEDDDVISGLLSFVFIMTMVTSLVTVSVPSVNVNVMRYVLLVS